MIAHAQHEHRSTRLEVSPTVEQEGYRRATHPTPACKDDEWFLELPLHRPAGAWGQRSAGLAPAHSYAVKKRIFTDDITTTRESMTSPQQEKA